MKFDKKIILLLFAVLSVSSVFAKPLKKTATSKVSTEGIEKVNQFYTNAMGRIIDTMSIFLGIGVVVLVGLQITNTVFSRTPIRRLRKKIRVLKKQSKVMKNKLEMQSYELKSKLKEQSDVFNKINKRVLEADEKLQEIEKTTFLSVNLIDENAEELSKTKKNINQSLEEQNNRIENIEYSISKNSQTEIVSTSNIEVVEKLTESIKLDEAIELKSENAEIFFNRGNTYYKKGENDESKKEFIEAGKNFEKAKDEYDKAIKLKPDYAEAFCNRGNVYHKKGEYDKAIKDYADSIKFKCSNLENTYNSLGATYIRKGERYESTKKYKKAEYCFDKAMNKYNKAIEINSDCADAYNGLGAAYFKKGEIYELVKNMYEYITNANETMNYSEQAKENFEKAKENFEKAKENFEKAYELNPNRAGHVENIIYVNKKLNKT